MPAPCVLSAPVRRRSLRRTAPAAAVALPLAIAICTMLGCKAHAQPKSLLAGRAPMRQVGVRNAAVLTDGVIAPAGDAWSTDVTAIFDSQNAFVEYDLGRSSKISAAFLQGDNNDSYLVQISNDGSSYTDLWVAGPADGAGLRARSTASLSGSGRYVRVRVRGGDGHYSLSELLLFASTPKPFPPHLTEREGMGFAPRVRDRLLFFGASLALLLFATGRRSGPVWLLLAAVPAVAMGYGLHLAIRDAFPLQARELSLLRAVLAGSAGLALLRQRAPLPRFPAHRGAVHAVLALAGLLSFASFYGLGHPQFWNYAESRPEFVHTTDMRIYYPFAKYFEELGYDGVYLASAAAYLDDVPGATIGSIGNSVIRDLHDHSTHRLIEVSDQLPAVRARFTPARWESFKRDMAHFRRVMGPEYLETLGDHGANATPVWVFFARLLFNRGPADERTLVLGGLLDAFFFALTFIAIGRSFGLRQMWVAMVVFGANDFYMFGTNWGGATLRHDWLAYLGLGVCALHSRRFALGGVLFGLSTMVRAFPGVALMGVSLCTGFAVLDAWRERGRPPSLRALLSEHRDALRVLVAAAACMLVCFVVTSICYSPGAWIDWWQKVTLLNAGLAVNDESLTVLVAGVDGLADKTLRSRQPLLIALTVLALVIVASSCRKRRLDQAAVLALPLIPVLTNPANYYDHFVFLLPLAGTLAG
ncbi:MAG: discoidin domain-containing protein, partial [Polyangiales bacterium]